MEMIPMTINLIYIFMENENTYGIDVSIQVCKFKKITFYSSTIFNKLNG